jgi:hypothetical protein
VGLICALAVLGASVSFADGDTSEPGDPGAISPGMNTLEPTPVILCECITVLVAVASLILN